MFRSEPASRRCRRLVPGKPCVVYMSLIGVASALDVQWVCSRVLVRTQAVEGRAIELCHLHGYVAIVSPRPGSAGLLTCGANHYRFAVPRRVLRSDAADVRQSAGVVKMRRGQTARVWREVSTHGDAYAAFQQWVDELAKKARCAGFRVEPSEPMMRSGVRVLRCKCSFMHASAGRFSPGVVSCVLRYVERAAVWRLSSYRASSYCIKPHVVNA